MGGWVGGCVCVWVGGVRERENSELRTLLLKDGDFRQ